ncbi:MAG: hypothetical protein H0V82_04815 [Candidatus Protochlamydia sp.]|nr:hypothetical protein [Candidatus Protochlamydia sp.]
MYSTSSSGPLVPELFTVMDHWFPSSKLEESEKKLRRIFLKIFIFQQRDIHQIIITFLMEFVKNTLNTNLRSEALSLLFLIKSHLEYIYLDGYPVLISRDEIKEFLK